MFYIKHNQIKMMGLLRKNTSVILFLYYGLILFSMNVLTSSIHFDYFFIIIHFVFLYNELSTIPVDK